MANGINHRGRGTWRNVTNRAVNVGDNAPVADATPVTRARGAKTVNARFSAGGDRAFVATGSDGSIAARAIAAADARGCRRVWDIDVAMACGYPATPDGAAAFRAAWGIPASTVSTPWPTRVTETPDAAYRVPGAPDVPMVPTDG